MSFLRQSLLPQLYPHLTLTIEKISKKPYMTAEVMSQFGEMWKNVLQVGNGESSVFVFPRKIPPQEAFRILLSVA
jgi:hypothetical protein